MQESTFHDMKQSNTIKYFDRNQQMRHWQLISISESLIAPDKKIAAIND